MQTKITKIYANQDKPAFFDNVMKIVEKSNCEHCILVGDYNFVLDPNIDSKNRHSNNQRSCDFIKAYMSANNYCDPWRVYNPDRRQYTCYKKNPRCAGRLDFFLITQSLLGSVENATIEPCVYSDHKIIQLKLALNESTRGPGVWRLNTALLGIPEVTEKVIQKITEICNLCNLNVIEKWEYLKSEVTVIFKEEGKRKKKKGEQDLIALKNSLGIIEDENLKDTACNKASKSIELIEHKIDELETYVTQGAIVRSRIKWHMEGERNSKYFFALEKRHFKAKTITKIRNSDGSIITECAKILRELESFYQVLYTECNYNEFTITNSSGVFLCNEDKMLLEQDINVDELWNAISTMKLNKAPGLDGLPVEFYRTFWTHIKDLLLELYRKCYDTGLLNPSSRKGVISLLLKGDKDPTFVKNWRPLTLLNLDYKIIAKLLASRMKKILDKIIGPQQTGFMEGRQISENIRKTMDVISYANRHKEKRWIIMSIDFEKCFDWVSYSGLRGALNYFKFGPTFIHWCSLFFNDFAFCTQNEGYLSNFHVKSRSINQGCPISPYLFLLTGEIMMHKLREHKDIRGIELADLKLLISQFADDTVLFLNFDSKEINGVIEVFTHIENQLGLKISYDKTTVYRIGSLRGLNAKLYATKQLQWSDGNIPLLGVNITNSENVKTDGFNKIIEDARKITHTWHHRRLTLMGKILVINTLVASLFVYRMAVLPILQTGQIKRIDQLILDFLWGHKRPKININILKRDKDLGGLNLVDILSKHRAMHLQWVEKVIHNEDFRYVYAELLPGIGERVWELNLTPKHLELYKINEHFWKEVLNIWLSYHYQDTFTGGEVANQILFYNSCILREGIPIVNVKCLENGLITLGDIMVDGQFISYAEVLQRYGNCLSWLEYLQLKTAIPSHWKNLVSMDVEIDMNRLNVYMLLEKKCVKKIYTFLKKGIGDMDFEKRYVSFCKSVQNIDFDSYLRCFELIYKTTKVTKFRNFQYKQLLNKIYTNDTLFIWKIKNTEKCDFCDEKQTVKHLFWECIKTKPIIDFIEDIYQTNFVYMEWYSLRMNSQNYHLSSVVLIAKYYIYTCKLCNRPPSIEGLIKTIDRYEQCERYNAVLNKKLLTHSKIWNTWGIRLDAGSAPEMGTV